MLLTTTNTIEGQTIQKYIGVVYGETILGTNAMKDLFASIRDVVGGRSTAYEQEMRKARDIAMQEMEDAAAELGANAIVGVDLDYATVGQQGSMMMVTVSGTAVRIG